MLLIDSHCHLDAAEFDLDRNEVVARAREAGVRAQVVPAVQADAWPKLRDVCGGSPGLYPAYGLHPMYLEAHRSVHLQDLRGWIERERPVAVGECGLDYFVDGLDREAQQAYFEGQLRLAREFDLPVIVHARRAVDAVIASLRRIGGLRGVVHSWSGSEEQARQLWRLDFLLGIGGPVTFDRARRLRRLVADMPLQHLLLETDAPDQPDAGIRGQRNEPGRLATVLQAVAALRDADPDEIARTTSANAAHLFGLPLPPARLAAGTPTGAAA
ncbi:TatD family deoxyribonuclease [Luteimonas viscosa]|uniref:TatD family deoxyribonuclease n=1 Tax=Luteimonas viscosa TaxID=1132694 RepID=A0A5D4XL92_9GAMM|nr:TatD family hydrolase [Luteimonas viscosa]TYT23642.1 TatD family deoxyribonuclease [Luteimonas viscosa]